VVLVSLTAALVVARILMVNVFRVTVRVLKVSFFRLCKLFLEHCSVACTGRQSFQDNVEALAGVDALTVEMLQAG